MKTATRSATWLALAGALALLGGCEAVSYGLANIAPELPGPKVRAEYAGLTDRTVAVIVYADMNVRYEFPTVREEIGATVGRLLERHVTKARTVDVRRVVRYQDSNPRWRSESLAEIGRSLGADSVLYISLQEFSLHERGSLSLPKGRVTAQVSVWEARPLPEGQDACQWRRDDVSAVVEPPAGTWIDRRQLRYLTQNEFATAVVRFFHDYRLSNKPEAPPSAL